jgi:hypothetical protein
MVFANNQILFDLLLIVETNSTAYFAAQTEFFQAKPFGS